MNIQELNDLDINDVASWPALAKGILIAFICALIGGAGYYALIADSIKKLDQTRQQEVELKSQFEVRAAQASSLNAYRQQMIQLEEMLKTQLKLKWSTKIGHSFRVLPEQPFRFIRCQTAVVLMGT